MNAATASLITTEQLLAMPETGMDYHLIRGELREKPMTYRNRRHSRALAKLALLLGNWLAKQPEPRGEILGGDVAFRIRRDPDTTVGIDLAYITAELAAAVPEDTRVIDGIPVLAVEILSPSNTQEEVIEKVQEYLDAGISQTWVVEPVFRTVTVYRPGAEPQLINSRQELLGEPELPGFRVPVTQLFR